MRTAEIQKRVPGARVLPAVGPRFTPTVTVLFTLDGQLYARNVSREILHSFAHALDKGKASGEVENWSILT